MASVSAESQVPSARSPSDEALLDQFQRAAFGYFLRECNHETGLVADTTRPNAPASIAVVGFALSSYPVGVERGWMTRTEAATRTLTSLRFFWNSLQGELPDTTGYKGFYYHFLDLKSGRRVWQCELSMIDTAFLIAGMLTASSYFTGSGAVETEIREFSDLIYRRVDWQWALNEGKTLALGWKPDGGFLHYAWDGYDEALMLYVLGMASPTHPLPKETYSAWTATYQWENIYDLEFLYAGPLFIHQFSHAWIDFRGIRDPFMREKCSDYFENSRRATYVQREYARRNPWGFAGYGEDCWGFSAGDGLSRYAARGIPYGPDDGTIAPWAPLASLPFAPEIALSALRHILETYPGIIHDSRLPSGFNPTLTDSGPCGWVSDGYFGLDQGIIVLMIENHRSQLIWDLMRRSPHIEAGLCHAGFTGGWLSHCTPLAR